VGDNGPGGDDRPLADGHSRKDRHPRRQPYPVSESDWGCHKLATATCGGTHFVVHCQERDMMSNAHAVADSHGRAEIDMQRPGNARVFANGKELFDRPGTRNFESAHDAGARANANARCAKEGRTGS